MGAHFRWRNAPKNPPVTAEAKSAHLLGDRRERFAALYDHYFALIFRYCYARLGAREPAVQVPCI